MTRARQDDVTRRRRILRGACPTHGIALTQGRPPDGVGLWLECPRRDCKYEQQIPHTWLPPFDADHALEELRRLASAAAGAGLWPNQVSRLGELVMQLDESLSHGGPLPSGWKGRG